MRLTRTAVVATALAAGLVLAACGSEEDEPADDTAADAEETADEVEETVEETVEEAADAGVERIAFFGFWSTNSFTQAVLAGIEEAAAAEGIEVVDLSTPEFDAAGQIAAMQDQTVKGDAQMYVTLANDSVGLATAAEEAIAAGITVVAAFTPLGADFSTLEPQVDGLVVVAETPTSNGANLADLAIQACEGTDPCQVAYLEGLAALPLDNARTGAFVDQLATAGNVELVAQVEGGYTPDTGQAAAQDVLQANPDVNVMVGSSQAIIGAQNVVDTAQVKLVGNGASTEAFEGVTSGEWFALYNLDLFGMGATAVDLGLQAAAGEEVEPFDIQELRDPLGTADVIAEYEPVYSDLG